MSDNLSLWGDLWYCFDLLFCSDQIHSWVWYTHWMCIHCVTAAFIFILTCDRFNLKM